MNLAKGSMTRHPSITRIPERNRLSRWREVGLLLACLVAAAAAIPAAPAEDRSVTPMHVVRVRQLADPQVSPAGDRVAVVVSELSAERTRGTALWLVSVDGQAPMRLTFGSGGDHLPRWSADGSTLAFASRGTGDRTGRVSLYSLAARTTSVLVDGIEGARDLQWSPDGSRLALLRFDPESPEEVERREIGDDARVVGRDQRHIGLWLVDASSGTLRRLSRPGRTYWSCRWSEDGSAIVALASSRATAEGLEYQSQLVVIDVASGEETTLASRTNPQAAPCFSPDGKWVAYMGPVGRFKERGVIHVVAAAGGEPRQLLQHHRGHVWDLRWHPRDNRLLAAVAEGPTNWLASVSLDGEVRRLHEIRHSLIPYWDATWSVSGDGSTVAFLSEEGAVAREVWIASLDGSSRRRPSNFNRHFEELDLGEVEAIRWTNPVDSSEVEGILVTPPNQQPEQRSPLLVWLHGGPAYNWGLGGQLTSWAQLFASHGYLVLLPNFRGSSGYGMEWMTANVRDWGDGPMGDVLSGVDHLVTTGVADPDRLFVGGGSYGGYLTYWTIGHSDRFRAAFVRAGVADLATEYASTDEPSFLVGYFDATPYDAPQVYRDASPLSYAHRVRTPLLVVHGEKDLRVPVSQSLQFYDALQHYEVPSELVVYPREGHGIRELVHQIDVMERALAWFERWDVPPARADSSRGTP